MTLSDPPLSSLSNSSSFLWSFNASIGAGCQWSSTNWSCVYDSVFMMCFTRIAWLAQYAARRGRSIPTILVIFSLISSTAFSKMTLICHRLLPLTHAEMNFVIYYRNRIHVDSLDLVLSVPPFPAFWTSSTNGMR